MKLLDLIASTVTLYKSGTALHLKSMPGVGKSMTAEIDMVKALSEAYDEEFGFLDCLLPTLDAPDLRGYLFPVKGTDGRAASEFTRSPLLPPPAFFEKYKRGLFLVDERDAADHLTQKAVAPFILSKRLGNDRLPAGWWIVSCSNRAEDMSGVGRPLKHLVNRERTLVIDSDVTSWSTWAEAHGVHPMMVAFAKFKPGAVFLDSVPKNDGPYCTPRSFVSANGIVVDAAGVDSKGNPNMKMNLSGLMQQMIAGDIGDGTSAELFGFFKTGAQLPSIEEIEANPSGAKCPTELSAAYAAMQLCVHHATTSNVDKLWTYTERLPKELQTSAATSLVKKGGGTLLNSQALTKWIAANRTLIAASNF